MNRNVLIIGGAIVILLIIVIYIEWEKSKLEMSIAGATVAPIQNVTVNHFHVTNNIVQNSATEYSIENLTGEQITVGENNTLKQNIKSCGNI